MESQTLLKNIGIRLKATRIALTDKQSLDIANTLKIAPSTYSQHETGKRSPSLDSILRYCEFYKVSPEWLLTGVANITVPYRQDDEEQIKKKLFLLGLEDNSKLAPIVDAGRDLVDLNLLLEIFSQLISKFTTVQQYFTQTELTNFCLDVYNSLVNIDTSHDNKKNMVLLSIDSLNAGLKKSALNGQKEKVS